MGYDLNLTRAGARADAQGAGGVPSHARHGRSSTPARAIDPDLSDCPPNKLWRSQQIGAGIGDAGPVRPHPGAGRAGLGDRPRGRAHRGRADHRQARQGRVLRHRPRPGAAHAAASPTSSSPASRPTSACTRPCARPTTAATSACCCRDCTGATDYGNYHAALKMVTMQGGVFGAVANSEALLAAILPMAEAATA